MKKIELTAPLRFVLVILIWLLTLTVVSLTGNIPGTLNNGGVGLIGTLVFYVGALYLAFSYFDDCQLKKTCKLSLLVMVIIVMFNLFVQAFAYFISLCNLGNNNIMTTISDKLTIFAVFGRNIAIIVFLILSIVQTLCAGNKCCCNGECKEVEAKEEETEEEAPAAEEAAEEKEAE